VETRFRTIDDVLDFAIARETESRRFYADLAPLATRPEVRAMIGRLATDELQHGIHLEAIKAGEVPFASDEDVGSLDIEEALAQVTPQPGMSYADLLVIAMKKEKAAFRLYTELAALTASQALRDVLMKLAREEAEHKLRLELEYDWATF
jgi:rubrerythrin